MMAQHTVNRVELLYLWECSFYVDQNVRHAAALHCFNTLDIKYHVRFIWFLS